MGLAVLQNAYFDKYESNSCRLHTLPAFFAFGNVFSKVELLQNFNLWCPTLQDNNLILY